MKTRPLRLWLGLVVFALGCATAGPDPMSQESLALHIQEIGIDAKAYGNVIQFDYEGIAIACVSDATYDRMRLIAPVATLNSIESVHLEILLTANFHTTLDARYAISEGVVYATFLHPLSTLSRMQLESAIRQVSALARNFGSSYSSDELLYGVELGEEA